MKQIFSVLSERIAAPLSGVGLQIARHCLIIVLLAPVFPCLAQNTVKSATLQKDIMVDIVRGGKKIGETTLKQGRIIQINRVAGDKIFFGTPPDEWSVSIADTDYDSTKEKQETESATVKNSPQARAAFMAQFRDVARRIPNDFGWKENTQVTFLENGITPMFQQLMMRKGFASQTPKDFLLATGVRNMSKDMGGVLSTSMLITDWSLTYYFVISGPNGDRTEPKPAKFQFNTCALVEIKNSSVSGDVIFVANYNGRLENTFVLIRSYESPDMTMVYRCDGFSIIKGLELFFTSK